MKTIEGLVKTRILLLGLSACLVLLDQLTKIFVLQNRPYFMVIPGFFNITYVENRGAAFGILQGRQFLLAVVSLVAIFVLVYLLFYESEKRKGLLVAISCILGGTIGNFIDRVFRGYVVDFLDFHIGTRHWPSFNIADSAISIGVGMLIVVTVWEEFFKGKREPSSSQE